MAHDLYNHFAKQSDPFARIIEDAQKFKKTFSGNPQEEVMKLVQSGQMSQAELNRLMQIAAPIAQRMGK